MVTAGNHPHPAGQTSPATFTLWRIRPC